MIPRKITQTGTDHNKPCILPAMPQVTKAAIPKPSLCSRLPTNRGITPTARPAINPNAPNLVIKVISRVGGHPISGTVPGIWKDIGFITEIIAPYQKAEKTCRGVVEFSERIQALGVAIIHSRELIKQDPGRCTSRVEIITHRLIIVIVFQ